MCSNLKVTGGKKIAAASGGYLICLTLDVTQGQPNMFFYMDEHGKRILSQLNLRTGYPTLAKEWKWAKKEWKPSVVTPLSEIELDMATTLAAKINENPFCGFTSGQKKAAKKWQRENPPNRKEEPALAERE